MKRSLIMATAMALAVLPATADARPWGGHSREARAERPAPPPYGRYGGAPPDGRYGGPSPDGRFGGVDEGDMRRGYGRGYDRDGEPMVRAEMNYEDAAPPPPEFRADPPPGGWVARLFGGAPRWHGRGRRGPHW